MKNKKNVKQREFNIPIKIYENESDIKNKQQFAEIAAEKNEESLMKNDEAPLQSFSKPISAKNLQQKKKIMWSIVGIVLVAIIPVWIVFLRFNIMLNNSSATQIEEKKEWSEIQNTFGKAYNNIQNFVSNFDLREKKKNEIKAESEKKGIKPDDVKKLKEKILNE